MMHLTILLLHAAVKRVRGADAAAAAAAAVAVAAAAPAAANHRV